MPIRLNFFRVLPCSALFLGTSGVREGREASEKGGKKAGIRRWGYQEVGWMLGEEKGTEGKGKEKKRKVGWSSFSVCDNFDNSSSTAYTCIICPTIRNTWYLSKFWSMVLVGYRVGNVYCNAHQWIFGFLGTVSGMDVSFVVGRLKVGDCFLC